MQSSHPGGDTKTLIAMLAEWFAARSDVHAIAVVGSVARGTARPDSDIDLVLLVDDPEQYREDSTWLPAIPWHTVGLSVSDTYDGDFGALWSRFVTLVGAPIIEFGFSSPQWASTEPIDAGTLHIIQDGCRILYDPHGLLARLVAAARE
ncbi:MAG: nucleotidyltransferase domain-containing protein [Chloroflexales bacterium]|nr:nucleotidyltransferase domain-containing protein [Chloroflexales bacterium]